MHIFFKGNYSFNRIGFAIARRLAQDGAKVLISSRRQENVDKALKTLRDENLDVEGLTCHVGKASDRTKLIEAAKDKFGGIDVLVSNAAVSTHFGSTLDTPEASFDKMFDINVKSSFMLVKEVVPEMEKRGKGSIALVASIAGFVPFDMIGVYSMTKTTLLGMTKVLAPELAHSNIRINCICPGLIQTKFSDALTNNEHALEIALGQIPMRRLGQPEDMGGAASFLASDDSAFMTGENIVISGGQFSRL